MVGRVETSMLEVSNGFRWVGQSGLGGWMVRTVGEEQHVSFYIAGAIVGYDEISLGGGL